MSDKVENAVEKSDQYHEMLMKPVTVANHKQMEKTVDAAIAHAKRVGDDDLLELAEEIGREILALRSRASRPGAKAKMGADEWPQWGDGRADEIIAEMKSLDQKCQQKSREIYKAGSVTIPQAIGAATAAKKKKSWELLDQANMLATLADHVRRSFSRSGAKAKFDKSAAKALWIEMFNFWDRNRADDIVRLIPKIKTMIQKARSMPDYRMLKDGKTFGPSLHQLADEHEDAINERYSRPGAKAKMSLPNISELQKIVNKLIERGAYYASLEYKPAEKRRVVKGHQQDTRLLNDLLAAVQANNGAKAKATLAKIDPVLRAVLPKDTKAWASQHSRPGAKAEFAPITGRTGMNDREKMRVMDQAIRASGMTEMELKKNHPEIYQSVDRIRRNPGFYSVKDAAHIANKIKELKATASRPVPKATDAKPDETEREDVKAGLKLMEKADKAVSDKIRTLIKEGKPQDQAVAIALDMKRRGEL